MMRALMWTVRRDFQPEKPHFGCVVGICIEERLPLFKVRVPPGHQGMGLHHSPFNQCDVRRTLLLIPAGQPQILDGDIVLGLELTGETGFSR